MTTSTTTDDARAEVVTADDLRRAARLLRHEALVSDGVATRLADLIDLAATDLDLVRRVNTDADERHARLVAAGYGGPDGQTRIAPHALTAAAVDIARAVLRQSGDETPPGGTE